MSEQLRELAHRLAAADERLLNLAAKKRGESLHTAFDGTRWSSEADWLEAKATGVRLALSYVNEEIRAAQRKTGQRATETAPGAPNSPRRVSADHRDAIDPSEER